MTQRFIIALGIVLLIAAAVWHWGVRPAISHRFPSGWGWEVNSIGRSQFADPVTGVLPDTTSLDTDPINITTRRVSIAPVIGQSGQVQVTDFYQSQDPVTNQVIWEVTYNATLDGVTGRYVDPAFASDYYLFPMDLEQGTYNIRNSVYQGVPLTFQREEIIGGIATYLFSFRGDLPNEASYPDYPLDANQTIICFDFELDYWVEPNTGEMIQFRERCEGDYVVDTTTGERLTAVARWGAESTGDDVIRQSAVVRSALFQHQLIHVYIPLGLLISGLLVSGVGFLALRAKPGGA